MSTKLKLAGIGAVITLSLTALLWTNLVTTNNVKNYQVKQAAITGDMSVRYTGGMYGKFFGSIETYKKNDMFYFSKEKLDGGEGLDTQPLKCTFQGNSVADVSGIFKYNLPAETANQLKLHVTYGSAEAIKNELVRNAIAGALKQVGPMFRAEEAFITRRAEFTQRVRDNIVDGLVSTISEEGERKAEDGTIIKEMITSMKLDSASGKPIIEVPSVISSLGIQVIDFVIKDFDFDILTDELIQEKKKQEQLQVVARSNAERAKQDAITVESEGKARIASAKADELVKKITAVTQAQKEFEVAELQAKKAKQVALKIKAEGEAKAYANKKLNEAGLTPLKRAQIDKEKAIGVAAELSKWVGPKVVISGGSKGGNSGLGEAMQLKYLMDIEQSFNKRTPVK